MLLSIVTINYKKTNLTIASMQSLYSQFEEEFNNNNFELIIVDNASLDKSITDIKSEISKKNYKNITVIENKENFGFSKGCNIGAKNAKGDFFLFLNNDTIVKDKGILEMVKYMRSNSDVAILGGKLLNANGSEQASVGKFYNLQNVLPVLFGMERISSSERNPKEITKVDWVKGGLMMLRRVGFEKLGGFDEKIFMYIEDMELCFRAQKKGMKVFFYPHIDVEHIDQGSSNRSYAIVNIYQNLLYFYKKHKSPLEYEIIKFILKSKAISLITIGKLVKNNYLRQTYEKALKVA